MVGTKPVEITVSVDWSKAAEAPTLHVNQFVGQVGTPTAEGNPDGVYLLLGSVRPPVIVGSDEEARRRAIDELKGGLKVTVHGCFHMSRERLDEMIRVLQTTAEHYDAAVEAARGQKRGA